MTWLAIVLLTLVLIELAYISGYHRWPCPARDLHDALSRRKGTRK